MGESSLAYRGIMPAGGELVRCTDGSLMTRPPQSCPHGHLLRPDAMLVGHQPCSTCRGGHTTWTCPDCAGVLAREHHERSAVRAAAVHEVCGDDAHEEQD